MEREILFCLQALKLGLVDPAAARAAGRAWEAGEAGLRESLVAAARLVPEDVALLERTVERAVALKQGDARAAADSLGGSRALTESLIEVLRVEATLPRSEAPGPALPGSEATLARSAPAVIDDAAATAEVTPEAVGRYDVRGELGRGGIGRVLVAFDEHAGREVAIKELLEAGEGSRTSGSGSQVGSARFLREARLTAQLEHPAIVPVYEVGRRPDGTLYYTMKLVRGRTLAQALHEAPGVDARLHFLPHFAEMCSAVAFAHSRGVLHRDLKPQNVMIGEFGETILLDWGLAKLKGATEREDRRFNRQMEALRDVAAGKTVQGAALGTPEYMPPEQAWGDVDRIDEPSDTYSLGAVLYELLTGRPPFTGDHAYAILAKVQQYGDGKQALTPVRELAPQAPPELAAIAEKALFPQMHGRYRTAKDLLEDVHAFMAGRRVGAYRYGSLELVRRFVAQNRALSVLAAALLLTLVVGSGLLLGAWRAAEAGRGQAEAAELQVHRHLAEGYREKAARLAQERDWLGAQVFAAAALREGPYNPLGRYPDPATFATAEAAAATASLQSTLWAARHEGLARHLRSLEGHQGSVDLVRFSPDGARVATGGADRTVRVFEVASGRLLHTLDPNGGPVLSLAWSRDGQTLATGGEKLVRLWQPGRPGEPATLAGHTAGVTALVYSPDGTRLASTSRDRTVRLWDLAQRREAGQLPLPEGWTAGADRLDWSADGASLAGGAGSERSIALWDPTARRVVRALEGHEGGVTGVVFSDDSRRLFSLGNDRAVRTWEVATGVELGALSLGEGHPRGLAVRADAAGRTLLAAGRDEVTELWDVESGERQGLLRGHGAPVRAVSFSPDGRTLATAGLDRRVRLWAVSGQSPMVRLGGHDGVITALAVSRDGTRAVTGGRDKSLQLWDLKTRSLVRAWTAHEQDVSAVLLLDDGAVVSAGRDGIKLWRKEEVAEPLPGLTGPVRHSGLAASGSWLAAAGSDGGVRVWSTAGGAPVLAATLQGSAESLAALAFSPDGKTLAAGGRDRMVRLWAVGTWAPGPVWSQPERVRALGFSPDGQVLAVADYSWSVTLRDAATGEVRRVLAGHHDAVRSLAFSRDGSLLVTAGATDTTTRLWQVASGRVLQVIDLGGEARAAALLPDGTGLLTTDGNGLVLAPLTLGLWKQDPGAMLKQAQQDAAMTLAGFELRPL